MINKFLKAYVEETIIPKYIDFDKAHNISHVETVIKESLELAKHFDVDTNMVFAIAAYHDLGLCKDRKTHHIVSGEILCDDKKIKEWFNDSQILLMKEAIEDHRASSKTPPKSIYGKIIAEADRVIDPTDTIKRTLQFAINHHPDKDKEFYYEQVLKHMLEKYSENGYLKLWLSQSKNAKKLEELRNIIKNQNLLREIFEKLYFEENSRMKPI